MHESDIDVASVVDQVRDARVRNEFVTLYCHCAVEYDGRAKADLHGGDRFVVLKPDGTVLVHGPKGNQPRNWMNPGATTTVSLLDEDGLMRISTRQTSSEGVEELMVDVEEVYHVTGYKLVDGREKDLTGTEADLKERLVESPELIEEGFRVQETEYETGAGPVDIYGFDSEGVPVFVELKRRQIDPEAVHQLSRYIEQVMEADSVIDAEIRGVLIAPEISEQAEVIAGQKGFDFVAEDPRRKTASSTATLDEF